MNNAKMNGSVKFFIILAMIFLLVKFASAASYLPSTKYIDIQTEFDTMEITLEKTARVDFIAHCPDFSSQKCTKWNIYNTTFHQNASSVTFEVLDIGAFIGVHLKDELLAMNITRIKQLFEMREGIEILDINYSTMGLTFEFRVPLKGQGLLKLKEEKDAKIKIIGLKNETMFKRVERIALDNITIKDKIIQMNTEVVAIEASKFQQAEVQIPKNGPVNTIVRCAVWNFEKDSCLEWLPTDIAFTQDDNYIYFNVTSFSAYGGTELNILNVKSYPVTGGNWTVRFITRGTDNLRIEGSNGTIYGTDLEFGSLYCGDENIEVENHDEFILARNYSCNSTGYYKVKVLTGGTHTQKFTFGNLIAYANNLANDMPNKLNVEGKLTNSTGGNINSSKEITFFIYDDATAGNKLWQETQTDVLVNDGIFSAILGNVHTLNLTWAEPYYLQLEVANENMTPRINLSSSPYSKSSDRSFNLSCTDCISSAQIGALSDLLITTILNVTGWITTDANISTPKLCINGDCKTAWPDAASESGWQIANSITSLVDGTDDVNATSLYVDNSEGKV